MRLALYLTFLGLGVAGLLGGQLVTRLTWRPDIEPFSPRSSTFQILLRPERYATPDRLPVIRLLTFIGAMLIVCAIGVAGYEIALSYVGRR